MFAYKPRRHETVKNFSFVASSENFERWCRYDRW